jgi:hypothetical protein
MVVDSAVRAAVGAFEAEDLREPEARSRAVASFSPLLAAAYREEYGWPGTVVVRDALAYIDAGSESAFESWSRGWLIQRGLPRPLVGQAVRGASGKRYWVDFLWATEGVIGEADGLGKYGTDETTVRRALAAERARQADLEAAGYVVIRWSSHERPAVWLGRLERHVGLA